MHATLPARDFSLANFFPSSPFTCIFPNLSRFFPVLAVANTGSCVGLRNKIGHPAGCRFLCWVSMQYKLAQKTWLVAPQWGAADAEIKVPPGENIELRLKVLPLKPGVDQYIAMHATFTARGFFLANSYPSSPFTCIFSKTSPDFFPCWLLLTLVPA